MVAVRLLVAAGLLLHVANAAGDPRIEHFVVLYMECVPPRPPFARPPPLSPASLRQPNPLPEAAPCRRRNRPFDHMFGCMDLPGADSAATMTRNRSLPIDPTNASKGSVNVTCGTADYVCHGNMKYNIWAGKFANGSRGPMAAAAHFPYAKQNDDHSFSNGAQGHAIHMFSPAQLPVKTAIGKIVMLSRFVAVRLANPKSITIYFSPGVWRLQQALLQRALHVDSQSSLHPVRHQLRSG